MDYCPTCQLGLACDRAELLTALDAAEAERAAANLAWADAIRQRDERDATLAIEVKTRMEWARTAGELQAELARVREDRAVSDGALMLANQAFHRMREARDAVLARLAQAEARGAAGVAALEPEAIEQHIRSLPFHGPDADLHRTLVAGNLRNLAGRLRTALAAGARGGGETTP